MSIATLVNAMAVPPDARLDQGVPKKLLVERGGRQAFALRKAKYRFCETGGD